MVPEPVKIRADFKLTCYKFDGIDAIKAALLEGEKLSTSEIPIKVEINNFNNIISINSLESLEAQFMNAALLQSIKKKV